MIAFNCFIVILLNNIALAKSSILLNGETQLEKCLTVAVNSLIKNNYRNILITINNVSVSNYNYIKANSFINFKGTNLEFEIYLSNIGFNPSTYIIEFDNLNDVNQTLETIKYSKVYSTYSNIVLITKNISLIQPISEELWDKKLLRTYFLTWNNQFEVHYVKLIECGTKVATTKFFSSNCDLSNSTINLNEILKNCPLFITRGITKPYVNPENERLKGVFVEMIKVFGEVSHRKIVIRPYDPIYMAELVEAYNFASLLDSYDTGYTDIFLGPVHLAVTQIMDTSPILMEDNLMILLPRGFVDGPIDLLLTLFSTGSVVIGCLGFVVIIMVFHLFVRFTSDRDIFGSLAKTTLIFSGWIYQVSSLRRIPQNSSVRQFVILILYISMITNMAIQGISISLLNGPYYKPPIKSLKELIEMNYPIKMMTAIAVFFVHGSKYMDYYMDIYNRHKPVNASDMFEAGDLVLKEKNFATVITEGFLTLRPNLRKSFGAFKFFSNSHRVGMPKNYYMTKEFFELFTQMVEHGIMIRFMKLYEFFYSFEFYVAHSVRVYKLTIKHIAPAIILLLAGYFLASFMFLMEHFLHRLMLRRFFKRSYINEYVP